MQFRSILDRDRSMVMVRLDLVMSGSLDLPDLVRLAMVRISRSTRSGHLYLVMSGSLDLPDLVSIARTIEKETMREETIGKLVFLSLYISFFLLKG